MPPSVLQDDLQSQAENAVLPGSTGKSAVVAGALALAIAVFCAALIGLWFAFDSRIPTTDEAGHILNALDAKSLLRHARPFRMDWWPRLLTINNFYPPVVYIFNGGLKLVFGNGRWVDVLSVLTFSCVLTLSTFGITKIVSRSLLAACMAAFLVNMYPLIANISHTFMLDFPLTAMIGAGFLALLWWHERPTWRRCLLAGTVVTTACMTKQIAAAYLLLPGVWLFFQAAWSWRKDGSPRLLLQVLTIAACVLSISVPWAVANWHWIHGYSRETQQNMRNAGVHLTAIGIGWDYLVGLYHSMSPWLCGAFVMAAVGLPPADQRRLLPVYLCGIGGLTLISTLTWTYPLDRYAAGVLIATAVVTGYGASRLFDRLRNKGAFVLIAFVLLTFYQLLSFSYAPYPLNALPFPQLSKVLGVELREFRGMRVDKITPYAGGLMWGQTWVLDVVKARDGAAPVFLNILPSDGVFNPHSFELLVRESGMQMRPTTSRIWTIVGDDVSFSPTSAMYYHWYLVKSGFQGNQLKDAHAREQYDRLQDFVRTSGNFQLLGQHILPDSSCIYLYRQR